MQQLGDHVGQPYGQQGGAREQDDGDLRREDGQWEGPVDVDAEGGLQVTVTARGGWGEAVGHRLWGPHPSPQQTGFFFPLATLLSLRDLSSLTEDRTQVLGSESTEPNHWTAREFPQQTF